MDQASMSIGFIYEIYLHLLSEFSYIKRKMYLAFCEEIIYNQNSCQQQDEVEFRVRICICETVVYLHNTLNRTFVSIRSYMYMFVGSDFSSDRFCCMNCGWMVKLRTAAGTGTPAYRYSFTSTDEII